VGRAVDSCNLLGTTHVLTALNHNNKSDGMVNISGFADFENKNLII
jgi:hypothetical protein